MSTSTEQFLSMLQLSDSFFPTGSYTMSGGLEVLFKKRKKITAAQLTKLVEVYIEQQVGPADCCALARAHDSAAASDLAGVMAADSRLYSVKLVREAREASARAGTQLVRCAVEFAGRNTLLPAYAKAIREKRATGIYPVALAVACQALGVPSERACVMMLYSFCVSMAGAALRLGAIDHVAAQKVLHALKPAIAKAVQENAGRPLEEMWQFAPAIDILQMEHERMDSKMFIT